VTQHDRPDEVPELEAPLTGGRLTSGVARVGDAVRRPTGPHSPFVHRLLRHLEAVGFEGAPRLLGLDEHGGEMLSFIDGWVPPDLDHFADETVVAAARLLRRLHDATAGSELAGRHEVVCHNDPSPCNYVFVDGRPVAFIDFDHAAPGDRLRDVAYGGWLWTISADDGPPIPEQARRLRLVADAYGLPDPSVLLDAVLRRQEENRAAALARAQSRDPAVAEYGRASATWQREQMTWLREHADAFRAALATGGGRPAD
jgi:aminoglycoside phosphotransferase (APT) family kinase protein